MSAVVTPTNLGPEFEIGTTTPSKITVKVDGSSVIRDATTGSLSAAPIVFNNTTKSIEQPDVNGVPVPDIDLSQFLADIFVSGATLVAGILTLTDNDAGTPNVIVDLNALKGVSTDAANALVNGTDGKPFFNPATLATCVDAFGVDLFRAFPV